jgi:hypothetical protein
MADHRRGHAKTSPRRREISHFDDADEGSHVFEQ